MSTCTTAHTGKQSCIALENLQQRVACLADAGPAAIDARLAELDREWTAGRITKGMSGVLLVVGFVLAAFAHPLWLLMPAFGGVFLLQYLFTPTSWLGRLFHSMGYRTGFEVDQEKTALKIIRGDFKTLPTFLEIENQDDISRFEGEGGLALDPDPSKVPPLEAAKSAIDATQA